MNYQQCLEYLYQQLPMYQRIGNAAFKKSLDNIISLCDALGQPQHKFRSVHVAGTNGKGSSSHMLAAILQQAGYKTGLYTSPHLKDFTERVKINGQEIPREKVIRFVEANKPLFATIEPSFFEMTVALAFNYFAEEQVDIAVIEVGLGGRLDSTNIITPLVSLITNISFDHQSLLGDDLATIAGEKAGIIKPGVPAVISKTQPSIAGVFQRKSLQTKSPLFFADQEYQVQIQHHDYQRQEFKVLKKQEPYFETLQLDLAGSYQQYNLPGVLKTVAILSGAGYPVSEAHVQEGLKNVIKLTNFKGRWQVLQHKPLLICDTGHNEDGIRQIVQQLESLPYENLHFVFGAVNDKAIEPILELLPKNYIFYFCQAAIPRALPVSELQEKADACGLTGTSYLTVAQALATAKTNATEKDVIFVGGSTFVVAEIPEL